MTKKQQKEPFLHIQQTGIKAPVGHMQEIFISSIAEKEKKEQAKHINEHHGEHGVGSEKKAVPLQVMDEQAKMTLEKSKEENEEKKDDERSQSSTPTSNSANQERKRGTSFQRLKSFKEMSILERINYLVDFPRQLTPVSCIFETEEKQVRGILIGKSDETIEIRKQDGKMTPININLLTDIKMIGLRR